MHIWGTCTRVARAGHQGAYGKRCQALAVSHELSPPPASVERDLDNVTERIFNHHDGLLETVPLYVKDVL